MVCTYAHRRILAWGEIIGEYEYVLDDFVYQHRRAVVWRSLESFSVDRLSKSLAQKLQKNTTILQLTNAEFAEISAQNDATVIVPFPSITVDRWVENLSDADLSVSRWQVATFVTALQAKGFVILSGISGTGKTKLVLHFAAMLPKPSDESSNHLFLSVRPDWRDSKALLGYFNPLTEAYAWTPFLRFLERAARSYAAGDGLAWFVVLDEMNLAHVEYYFADMLSVMESGRDDEGWTREALVLVYPETAEGDVPPRELRLPPNLYVVGTVNVDETTHAFSPKVLDRAFSIELVDVDFSDYPPATTGDAPELSDAERQALLAAFTRNGRFPRIDKAEIAGYIGEHPEVRDWLQALNTLLHRDTLHFGYRVFDEIVTFLAVAEENGMFAELGAEAAFDAAVLMKVLPKFHGSRGKLQRPLEALLAWCLNPDEPQPIVPLPQAGVGADPLASFQPLPYVLPKTAERVQRMLAELQTDGFTAFG
ncbi:MAG: AAA family ATPase [Chloroflexota bacterium]|nr:AAA family ATPase [Chloroflexota bacterium]